MRNRAFRHAQTAQRRKAHAVIQPVGRTDKAHGIGHGPVALTAQLAEQRRHAGGMVHIRLLSATRKSHLDRAAEFEQRHDGTGVFAAGGDHRAGRRIGHAALHRTLLFRTGLDRTLRVARRLDLQHHHIAREIALGKQPGGRAEAAEDILFPVGRGIDQVALRPGRNDLLAEEQLQVALLEPVRSRPARRSAPRRRHSRRLRP